MLLKIATGGYYLNKSKQYCQIDGVTMGSPLGTILANLFQAQLENKLMNTNLDFIPAHYCRYVDDIFCVFDCLENANKLLNFINNLHPNKKFTHEIGPKQLAFLDTEIYLPSDIECIYTCKVL